MKRSLYLLAAFGFGAILTYGSTQLYQVWRGSQEWGVVVTTFGEGARLYGLFESKKDCSKAKEAFIEEYGAMASEATVPPPSPSRRSALHPETEGRVDRPRPTAKVAASYAVRREGR